MEDEVDEDAGLNKNEDQDGMRKPTSILTRFRL